mmetsp:Transcript_6948/g.21225  ORF Transcript_6948/g.21225 Transcript_6948/m.21225 type:complete len:417 (-) Transcript_6948:21-1271(-)
MAAAQGGSTGAAAAADARSAAEELLQAAYGEEEFGKTGHCLAGHTVIAEADVASVVERGGGSSLLYGELLPEAVEQLAAALFAGRAGAGAQGPVLELGMGTGKVALQLFLLPPRRSVYGVELAPSRWALADVALRRVAEAAPDRFQYTALGEGASRLSDLAEGGHSCEVVCGSLLETPAGLMASASAVVMEVCLPLEVQRLACGLLQHCRAGCRVVCYAPLHGLVQGCCLAPVRCVPHEGGPDNCEPSLGDGMGGLSLPASWKPAGHGFAFYELAASEELAAVAWDEVASLGGGGDRVEVDATGCPSRARRMRYTDDVLGSPRGGYSWGRGDRVLVGFSWLPFLDLGDPGDSDNAAGPDGVTWLAATVVSLDPEGFATICYRDDGTIEERVHPERIRKEGCLEKREKVVIDWGEDD